MLALSRSDLKQLVPMREAVELMKIAFRELSEGRAQAPVRTAVEVDEQHSAMLMMPGFVPAERALGFKVVNFFPGNPARGLPTINAIVCLIDSTTGEPLGIMEGGFVTALRTGAVSGAATDLMARPDSSVLAVIGAGVQGVTQAAAVCAVRPIERIIAVDQRPEQLERFQQSVAADWPDIAELVETTTDPAVALENADIVCTATTARTPVFDDSDVKPGAHINAVGAFTPEMQEIPPATVVRSRIVIDNLDAILTEAGDLLKPLNDGLISQSHFETELGQVVAGVAIGRADDQEITFFKSVGNAVQDVVVARYAIDQATARGAGIVLDLMA
ncbi:MAG TPA: ornithine cyclodeaminase [Thermomicrobiales bacterium]|nr:ornithine cyclodeaminase [Thermomicrobiales bacterium]